MAGISKAIFAQFFSSPPPSARSRPLHALEAANGAPPWKRPPREGREERKERPGRQGRMMRGNPPLPFADRHQFAVGSSIDIAHSLRRPLLFADKQGKFKSLTSLPIPAIRLPVVRLHSSVDVACLRRLSSITMLSSSEGHLRHNDPR